ncbi:SDR family NAD(P)-dependent oxidoreductase [Flavobacterium subsaxonicum]|uniref:Short-chain dehydrogenase n=1 Tax=Flavobacterium subsaxonicum WB 4.1-42 = DSM 21790 TaxID=1121898 RepID=A0A0A2MM93_9FLAO|nr:SDR family NAD(P)-dependent oxidoreductase [Flavobacterium subsaxonicum]KGO93449.1 short-chain dehydrogenase [Flavobacterium subsaxonicum WB 4.1-42 = DSM 21790]
MSTTTWFITGASKGFGLQFVEQLLAKGHNVAATSRSIADLEKAAGTHPNLLPLEVNLSSEQSVATAIQATIAKFGKLDNVVNNAGYGLFGGLEELSDAESRQNFEVNVFGTLNVIRQAMPHLREQKSGHIFNISSIGGFVGGFPGFGIYCATKFAVNGLTEALAVEAKPFNVNVTLVMPGYFRTSFLDSGSIAAPKNPIDAYASVRESQKLHDEQINGNQPGDPAKGVAEIIKVAEAPNPPLHLFLGTDAVGLATQKIADLSAEINAWKGVSTATDF